MMFPLLCLIFSVITFVLVMRSPYDHQKLKDAAWNKILKSQGRTLLIRQDVSGFCRIDYGETWNHTNIN